MCQSSNKLRSRNSSPMKIDGSLQTIHLKGEEEFVGSDSVILCAYGMDVE